MKIKKVYRCPECGYKFEKVTMSEDRIEVRVEINGNTNLCPNCGKELVIVREETSE